MSISVIEYIGGHLTTPLLGYSTNLVTPFDEAATNKAVTILDERKKSVNESPDSWFFVLATLPLKITAFILVRNTNDLQSSPMTYNNNKSIDTNKHLLDTFLWVTGNLRVLLKVGSVV